MWIPGGAIRRHETAVDLRSERRSIALDDVVIECRVGDSEVISEK